MMEDNYLSFASETSGNDVGYSETNSASKKLRLSVDSQNNGIANGTSSQGAFPIRKILKTTARGRNKFQETWLQLPEFKDWLAQVPDDVYAAHCVVCCTLLKNYSKSELQKHGRGKRHLENLGAKQQDPSYYIMVNPKLEIGDTTLSSEGESAASAVHYKESVNTNGNINRDNRFVTLSDLAVMLMGPLSFNYINEIPYFSGNYKEENLTVVHWFRRFERVASLAGWDGPTRLRILPLRLKGIMEDVFTCIENEYAHNLTYDIARQRMIERLEQR